MNLSQAKPSSYTTQCHLALSRALLHFRGTTFVETAVYLVVQSAGTHVNKAAWYSEVSVSDGATCTTLSVLNIENIISSTINSTSEYCHEPHAVLNTFV